MAVATYGVGDALTAKRYARGVMNEALEATEIWPLVGEGTDSIITEKTEMKKEKGDRVTVGLRTKLTGQGRSEGQDLVGFEEALATFSDSLLLNELNHAVRVKGKRTIDDQRILFDTRKEAKDGLRDWYAERMAIGFFLHVGGYIASGSSYTYTHRGLTVDPALTVFNLGNTTTAPTSNRKVFAAAGAGETNTADQDLESDDVFDLRLIDYAKELATTSSVPLRPITIEGEERYVVYLHDYQVTDMRTDTGTGQWMDFSKAAYNGRGKDNPIYSGALGMYNGVILRRSENVTPGQNSSTGATISTVRRAVFLGAQAAMIGFGSDFNPGAGAFAWVEETFNYQKELGVSVQSLLGLKKTVFNSLDFGSITISTYAAAHA